MSTQTLSRPLADELTERWRQADRASQGTTADAVGDAGTVLGDALVRPYLLYEDDDAIRPIANKWLMELEAVIDAAVLSVWEEHVVPAVVAAVIKKLPTAPEYLRVHPESKQLRADLEALVTA